MLRVQKRTYDSSQNPYTKNMVSLPERLRSRRRLPLKVVSAVLISMGVLLIGYGIYRQAISPKLTILTYKASQPMPDFVEFEVFIKNYGRVTASATLVCEVKYVDDPIVYSQGLDFTLNASMTVRLIVSVQVSANDYASSGGVAECYLIGVKG